MVGEYPIVVRFPKTFWKPEDEKGTGPKADPPFFELEEPFQADQLPSEESMSRPVRPPVVYMCIPVLTRVS